MLLICVKELYTKLQAEETCLEKTCSQTNPTDYIPARASFTVQSYLENKHLKVTSDSSKPHNNKQTTVHKN
jgi:hypothetical protein